jgi:hypothetical protein
VGWLQVSKANECCQVLAVVHIPGLFREATPASFALPKFASCREGSSSRDANRAGCLYGRTPLTASRVLPRNPIKWLQGGAITLESSAQLFGYINGFTYPCWIVQSGRNPSLYPFTWRLSWLGGHLCTQSQSCPNQFQRDAHAAKLKGLIVAEQPGVVGRHRICLVTCLIQAHGARCAEWVCPVGPTGGACRGPESLAQIPVRDRLFRERRGWDSNPRTLAGRRFSRPEPSTTRPPLHKASHQGQPAYFDMTPGRWGWIGCL